ncbi:DUF4214 domain-containing protein [Massilia sp. CFBP9026]|uniref:DUF4214 domain-containing protein n=1 Tax=Massilia sp. CFBP9026 TaxID=3096536 RepID=UPI002A6A2021|nr:DUF4214 domain-containing protein [Massilia sp. CFBP9026]MDY0962219.1 DUF4214 domain-containing protein [Massilia sp. CFBP9026]
MTTLAPHASTVNSFYLAFFGRPADPAGLKFWSEHLTSNNGDYRVITEAFANSEEAKVRFGDDTPAERIAEIYQQLFNRAPDATGLSYWANVVEQGNASLADVAIVILNGAQGSDARLVTLREQAAADFTAQVETSGSDYTGYAAVEAARVLVRAVTPGASQEDVAKLVSASVAFADIASTNPAVIDAIATGTNLLALFDTPRGQLDPVTLAQALADVAKAAAGSPATLESLLRGGGMAKVLEVMPAKATLQDVVAALAKGGLPAAIDVVYPPRPVTPPAAEGVTITFAGVDHDKNDPTPGDNITSREVTDVRFSFTGTPASGQKFQYKFDEKAGWLDIAPVGKNIIVPHLDLTLGAEVGGNHPNLVNIMEVIGNKLTTVQVRLVNADLTEVASLTQPIIFDQNNPTDYLTLVGIVGANPGILITDKNSVDVAFNLEYRDDGMVQWRVKDADQWITATIDDKSGTATLKGIDLSKLDPTIEVRVIDAAGNIGQHFEFDIDGPAGITVFGGPRGLVVQSQSDGRIALSSLAGPVTVTSEHASEGAVGGNSVVVGEQLAKVEGYLSVETRSGDLLVDASDRFYSLGSRDGETLTGSHLWGFGGNDTLIGNDGNNSLWGGDGHDKIESRGGSDVIGGGAGGDTIILVKDGVPSTLSYEAGDTLTGVFVNGGTVAGMDVVTGAEAGDVFSIFQFLGNDVQTVGTSYLTTTADSQVSLVRVELDSQGNVLTDAKGTSHLLQWTHQGTINSVLLQDIGYATPKLTITDGAITLAPMPVLSSITSLSFIFRPGYDSGMILHSTPAPIVADQASTTGLLENGELRLTDERTGQPAPSYTGGGDFYVQNGGRVQFTGTIEAGVYRIEWNNETFATTTGFVKAGQYVFAGGGAGAIVVPGFVVANELLLEGGAVHDENTLSNFVYTAGDGTVTELITGKSNDVIIADDGAVNVQYRSLEANGADLILGFGADDRITISHSIASIVEKQPNGKLDWAAQGDVAVVTPTTEAVPIAIQGRFVYQELGISGSDTLNMLNARIDLTQLASGESLLILAKDEPHDSAVLLSFTDNDGNHEIDAGELTVLAAFNDGVPTTEQIFLVGTEI